MNQLRAVCLYSAGSKPGSILGSFLSILHSSGDVPLCGFRNTRAAFPGLGLDALSTAASATRRRTVRSGCFVHQGDGG